MGDFQSMIFLLPARNIDCAVCYPIYVSVYLIFLFLNGSRKINIYHLITSMHKKTLSKEGKFDH